MSIPLIDLKTQYESIKNEIDEAIASVIDQASFVGGEIINHFEKDFAKYVGTDYCIAVANGTDAIEIALKALGIGPGDEVIVPALTWISTAAAISQVGAEPIFVDVLEKERTLAPSLIEEKITSKTKAIIPVHLYGLPARMNAIMPIAVKHGLKVIEDCAQAHGAKLDGHSVGTFGDLATFSFYPTKNLGAYGDAGCIVTNHLQLEKKCRRLANLGQLEKHDHEIIGRNSRLDALQAAILRVKLPYLETWILERGRVANLYQNQLDRSICPHVPKEMSHVFHLYVIQHPSRESLMKKLVAADIGHAVHYPTPLPYLTCYRYQQHGVGDFPVSEKLCEEVLSLPMYVGIKEDAIKKVCEIINE